jgi:molybdopterin-biosynthesis enzyme MoeA-like protein
MTVQWQSRVPDAIDALVAVFTAALAQTDVTIRDGASVSQARVTDLLSVGYTGTEENDVDHVVSTEGLGGSPDREQFTIRCAAACLRGGTDLAAARRRAYEIFGRAAAAITENRTLNQTVMRAMVDSTSLTQDQSDKGAQAVVTFSVTCDSYTR